MLSRTGFLKSFLSVLAMLLFTISYAQTKKISGTVLSDEDSKPLAGVTVSVKGKATATQTDASGDYTMDVATGESVSFSFVGYATQTIKVGAANTYNAVSYTHLDVYKRQHSYGAHHW